jgi:hypothetical protein
MKSLRASNLSNIASRSLAWLGSVTTELTENDTPQLLQVYVAAVICGDLQRELQNDVKNKVEKTRAKLNCRLEQGLTRCNGTTVLLCCVLEHNLWGEMLPALKDYADRSATALDEVRESVVAEEFYAARMLLAAVGLFSEPPPSALTFAPDLYSLLMGDEKTTRNLTSRIESLTCYGTYSTKASVELDAVLECLMMAALRRYNIELACTLLRSLLYLGKRKGLAIRTALQFILNSHNADGSFGFFDEEIKQLRKDGPEPYASLRIHLPVSLSCLWTLAEASLDDYRLFRDLGSNSLLVQAGESRSENLRSGI